MSTITVSSAMLIPSAKSMRLKPSQVVIIWEIANEVDRRRIPANHENGVWLEIPTKQLRNPDGRSDNVHLRKMLKELMGLVLEGEYKGDPWGAVLIAEYQITEGGSLARLFVPPAGIEAVRAPKTFAKIEAEVKYRMKGPAKLLYAALSDKKRQTSKPWHVYDLDELHHVVQCVDRYPKWYDFNRYVIKPAIEEINDYGTVTVKATPQKLARSIVGVRFDWEWKSLDAARETSDANDSHSSVRGKTGDGSAPPLTDEARKKSADFIAWQKENPGASYGEFISHQKSKNVKGSS
ncbi:hypothetical protein [Dinoroseobacter sp. S76]|uniref:hypothetical protein n=1 Tax=Dinoroseobacter sp. S76 TaxID=3415124 RepID=UPI003C7B16B3